MRLLIWFYKKTESKMNSLRTLVVWLLDVIVREPQLIRTFYSERQLATHTNINARNIFMADGRLAHGGMFDRLKGLISVYAVSKIQKKEFKIHFSNPFRLENYLEPNEYDWRIDDSEIGYAFPQSRPLFLYGECYAPRRLMKNRQIEAHFYYGFDSLREINARYGTDFDWGCLYHELFRPTAYLQSYINKFKQELGNSYIAIHTRFLNLLGDKMETGINPTLPTDKQEVLMETIYNKIREIAHNGKETRKVLLASDSTKFIQYMQYQDVDIYVIPGKIKHIDTAKSTDDGDIVKMFLDYYMLAGAQKVYSIVANGMWLSAFPEYAAKIGRTEFERIRI